MASLEGAVGDLDEATTGRDVARISAHTYIEDVKTGAFLATAEEKATISEPGVICQIPPRVP